MRWAASDPPDADRLIVMRRGRKVTEKRTSETDTQEIVHYMVGARDDPRAQSAAWTGSDGLKDLRGLPLSIAASWL